ncbi:MAG: PAS domain-containing protein, partial [Chloroflexi bacterium]|nr:PAS domain-containing protein [Chloroflexota bacterium]
MDHQDLTLFFTSILISMAITLLLAYFIVRRQTITGTLPLLFILLVEIIWIMGGLFGILAESPEEHLFWSTIRWILIFTFPALLYEYVISLSRNYLNRQNLVRAILTLIPAGIVILLLVFPQYNIPLKYFDLQKHQNITGQFSNLSLPLWIGLHFAYIASLYCAYLLLKHYNKQSRGTFLVYLTFTPSVLILLVGSFMGLLQIGTGRMPDFSPIAIGITNLFFAYYLYSNKVIEIIPIARDLILETMQDGVIIVDRKGRLLDINQAAREMTGIGVIKPAGQMVTEILPEWMAHIDIDQENANYLKQNDDPSTGMSSFFDISISNIRDQKGGLSGKLILIRRVTDITDPIINAKRSISLLESAVESRTDELRLTVDQLQSEISDRMKVEKELRFSESKFRTVIEQASEPFILIDEKNKVIESNRAFEKLINRKKEEFLGREVLGAYNDLLPPPERTREKIEKFKRMLNKIRAGESTQPYNQELDEVIALPDGTQKFIRYSIFRVLTEEGSRIGFI